MNCGKRHGSPVIASNITEEFATCIETCALQSHCRSVDYQEITKTCYQSAHHGEPTVITPGFSAAYVIIEPNDRGECPQPVPPPACPLRQPVLFPPHRPLHLRQIHHVEIKALVKPFIQIPCPTANQMLRRINHTVASSPPDSTTKSQNLQALPRPLPSQTQNRSTGTSQKITKSAPSITRVIYMRRLREIILLAFPKLIGSRYCGLGLPPNPTGPVPPPP